MADIKKELNDIKNAVYGREVRGAIHDGIKKINEETEKATDLTKDTERRQDAVEQQFDDLQQNYTENSPSTAEVVAARTNTETNENYNTIGRRMDKEYKEVTTKLAEKADKVVFEEYRDMTDVALARLDAKIEGREFPDDVVIENLFDPSDIVVGRLDYTNGNLVASEHFRTSQFIDVWGGEYYTLSTIYYGGESGSIPFDVRLVEYGKDENFIDGHSVLDYAPDFKLTVKLNKNTKYVRISVSVYTSFDRAEELVFNIGSEPMTSENEGTVWNGGFWEGIPTPPLRDGSVTSNKIRDKAVTVSKLSRDVLMLIERDPVSPEPIRLQGTRGKMTFNYPAMMSNNGEEIYFINGGKLRVSTDPFATSFNEIYDFGDKFIQALRQMDNGELLVSVRDNPNAGELWISDGYGTNDVSWNNVLTGHRDTVRWMDRSISVYGEFVVVGDYGNRGEATKVYLSTDYGKTFVEVFDIREETDGNPDDAHIHGVCFDQYYNRIWIVTGDVDNAGTYYSDDFGRSWERLQGKYRDMQFTTVYALEKSVLFGTDDPPNGLFRYVRNDKYQQPELELVHLINNTNYTSHVSQMFYKKPGHGNPLYMSYTVDGKSHDPQPGIVLATVDGINVYEIFRDYKTYEGALTGVLRCFGPTKSGHVLFTVHDGNTPFDRFVASEQIWK